MVMERLLFVVLWLTDTIPQFTRHDYMNLHTGGALTIAFIVFSSTVRLGRPVSFSPLEAAKKDELSLYVVLQSQGQPELKMEEGRPGEHAQSGRNQRPSSER